MISVNYSHQLDLLKADHSNAFISYIYNQVDGSSALKSIYVYTTVDLIELDANEISIELKGVL